MPSAAQFTQPQLARRFLPRLTTTLLWVGLTACSGADQPAPQPDRVSLRTTQQGAVIGYTHPDRAAHVWKGLPFAAPPIGALRWRAPQPPAAWSGTRSALNSANECVQLKLRDASKTTGNEDCLYLDIYAPRFTPQALPVATKRRPVMVWIHGGGNSLGSAKVYDASRLAVDGDVIVVAIQYRLGVLGWFSHPALRASATNPDDASGNFGTLDTLRALQWVKANISAFGGDPNNVTVFGESAGGIDVYALLLSPLADGLFQRAIAQSGVLVSTPRAEAEGYTDASLHHTAGTNELLLQYLLNDGSAANRAAAKAAIAAMSSKQIESYLRAKTPEQLLAIFREGFGAMYSVPQIIRDGHVIVDMDPLQALATPGKHIAVPTLAGTNREETKLFAMFASPNVRHLFGMPIGIRDERGFDLEGEYGGLLWKARGVDQPLAALQASGASDIYGYRFDWDEQGNLLWLDLSKLLGASHAVELLFVFGFTDLGSFTNSMFNDVASASRLSEQMRSYWTWFAHTGAPGRGRRGTLPEWSAWRSAAPAAKYLVFDSPAGGGIRMSPEAVTVNAVVARLAADPRVISTEERCVLFRGLVQFSDAFTDADYSSFNQGACSEWPIERPPFAGT